MLSEPNCPSLKWVRHWHLPPRVMVRGRSGDRDTQWLLSTCWRVAWWWLLFTLSRRLSCGGGDCGLFRPCAASQPHPPTLLNGPNLHRDPGKGVWHAHKVIKKMSQIKGCRGSEERDGKRTGLKVWLLITRSGYVMPGGPLNQNTG